jgi:hypothetical protein
VNASNIPDSWRRSKRKPSVLVCDFGTTADSTAQRTRSALNLEAGTMTASLINVALSPPALQIVFEGPHL